MPITSGGMTTIVVSYSESVSLKHGTQHDIIEYTDTVTYAEHRSDIRLELTIDTT